jgi:hypothetical protein
MDTRADPGFRSLTNLYRSTTIVRNGQTYGILGAAIGKSPYQRNVRLLLSNLSIADNMPLQTYLGSGTVVFPHYDFIKQGVQTFKDQGINKVLTPFLVCWLPLSFFSSCSCSPRPNLDYCPLPLWI